MNTPSCSPVTPFLLFFSSSLPHPVNVLERGMKPLGLVEDVRPFDLQLGSAITSQRGGGEHLVLREVDKVV